MICLASRRKTMPRKEVKNMTSSQMKIIEALRRRNYSYAFIGERLSLSANTVKSICRRKHFDADGPRKTKAEKQSAALCKYCSAPLEGGRKDRAFCSDECRSNWWKENRKVIEIKP